MVFSTAATPYKQALTVEKMNPNVRAAEYAVRGRQANLAMSFEAKLASGPSHGLPFNEIISCNIGNPQNLGQKPITFFREVMALVTMPSLLSKANEPHTSKLFAPDAIARANLILNHFPGGVGQYSASQGLAFVRKNVAAFISKRDGNNIANPDHIFLTNGASEGIATLLQMIVRDQRDGIFIPIPQYPLYSATLALLGAPALNYDLNEATGWGMAASQLRDAHRNAKRCSIQPRALVVINPGNPTGQVLSTQSMKETLQFCYDHQVILLADEVYQENVYNPDRRKWRSFKAVLQEMEPEVRNNCELVSFHSTSKGFLGECGFRGGYMELVNINKDVQEQILKKFSMSLCSNVPGQIMTDLMVRPPAEGEHSYPRYVTEKNGILASLKRRSEMLVKSLNALQGFSCNPAEGAMYVFPQVKLPPKAISAAKLLGLAPDAYYSEELLKATGICVVPGSGFGQEEGTFHFRTTFLPQEEKMQRVTELFATFNAEFMRKHA